MVADGVVSYLCKRGSTVVCNGNQHAAPLFQLNGKVDCLLSDSYSERAMVTVSSVMS